jgi:two-component system OmpR family sensor kinase
MRARIRQKWRPPLALVIGGTLAAVLCLPLIGVGYFRVAGNVLGWGETAWMIGWMAVVSTAILGFLLWRLVLRPVTALTAHAIAVKEGRNDAPLPPHFGTPELTALGQAVADMGATLNNREAGLRAFSAHVTHELKSPLTSIRGAAELLQGELDTEDRARLLATIQTAADQMQGQLEALRRLAAAREPLGKGPVLLSTVVEAMETGADVRILTDGPVPLDATALKAVLDHLIQNAVAHGANQIDLFVSGTTLRVTDNGSGIAEGNKGRIFDPFFTTRRSSGGTGLGLSIVRAMIEASGGEIDLISGASGAAFEIRF